MFFDSHCHLADEAFYADLPEVAARARAAGVTDAICILSADTPDEHARVDVVRAAWPGVRFATAVHPHRAGAYAGRVDDAVRAVREIAATVDAPLLGEMGLDYHYDFAPREVQQAVFAAQVELAVELDLPIAIHTRLATDDTVGILKEAGAGKVRGVMHCFTGTAAEARQDLDLGFYLSIPGIVTFPKAGELREVVAGLPLDRVLVETDARSGRSPSCTAWRLRWSRRGCARIVIGCWACPALTLLRNLWSDPNSFSSPLRVRRDPICEPFSHVRPGSRPDLRTGA